MESFTHVYIVRYKEGKPEGVICDDIYAVFMSEENAIGECPEDCYVQKVALSDA